MAFDIEAFQALNAQTAAALFDALPADPTAVLTPAPVANNYYTSDEYNAQITAALQAREAEGKAPLLDLGLGDGSALANGLGYGDVSTVGDGFGITAPEPIELLTQEEAAALHLSDEDFKDKMLEEAVTARGVLYDQVNNDPSSLEGMSLSQQLTFLYESNQRNGGSEAAYLTAANEIVDALGAPRERITDISARNSDVSHIRTDELSLLPNESGQIGVYGTTNDTITHPTNTGGVFDTLMRVASFIPSPFQPFAQGYVAITGVSDGDVTLSDALALAGVANFNPLAGLDNPLEGFTDGVNSALGIDAESAFALTDDVLLNLAEGDLKGAALSYADADMLPDLDGDSAIGDILASFDDNVLQPVRAALGPVGDAIGAVGSAIDDGITQRVIGGVKAAAEPLTTLVTGFGDSAQENILDPLSAFASTVDDEGTQRVIGGVKAAGDVLADVGEPIKEAIITGGDVLAEIGEPIKEAIITGGDALADVGEPIIGAVGDGLAAADDLISEALPSFNLDFSQIAGLFDMPQVSSTTAPTRTTDNLFGDLFKYTTEITRA